MADQEFQLKWLQSIKINNQNLTPNLPTPFLNQAPVDAFCSAETKNSFLEPALTYKMAQYESKAVFVGRDCQVEIAFGISPLAPSC